jgi:alkyl hydroperoxide reductase subunit D
MGLDTVKEALPAYARDLRLNLGAVTDGSPLDDQQLWGAVVTAALTSPPSGAAAELVAEARRHLSDAALDAAKSAAALMAMNNDYYRAKHLLSDAGVTGYDEIPARLRMQVVATRAGVKKADFELWCLVASAINGCGACLVAHEQALRAAGLGPPQIHEGLRIAAVVHAACATLAAEGALATA